MVRKEKRYDVWFLSDRKHTRMVVYYQGKSLSRVKAQALARMLNKRRGHKAIVLPHGEAPPEHRSVPDYKYRVGETVKAGSHGNGIIESRQRNFDWSGADDLYRVRVGSTLHLLGESQLRRVSSHYRRTTVARRRDPSKSYRRMIGGLEVTFTWHPKSQLWGAVIHAKTGKGTLPGPSAKTTEEVERRTRALLKGAMAKNDASRSRSKRRVTRKRSRR